MRGFKCCVMGFIDSAARSFNAVEVCSISRLQLHASYLGLLQMWNNAVLEDDL